MNDELRQICDDAWKPLGNSRTRNLRKEGTPRFVVIDQLAELHADPCHIDHSHIEREQCSQPVELAWIAP
jgi:hypothetical protein